MGKPGISKSGVQILKTLIQSPTPNYLRAYTQVFMPTVYLFLSRSPELDKSRKKAIAFFQEFIHKAIEIYLHPI